MIEHRPPSRIVEVRETFTPSDELRDALGNLLAPTMEASKQEAIKDSFVLKSWRRKILHESDYHGPHGEKNYSIQKAEIAFRAIQNYELEIGPKVGYSERMVGSLDSRVAMRPRSDEFARKVFNILNFIENDIKEMPNPRMDNYIYLDIPRRHMGRREQVMEAGSDLYQKLNDPDVASLYTVSPDDIVAKGKIEYL